MQVEFACGASDADGLELGAFEKDIGCFIGDFGIQTTHDTGKGDGAFAVGDDEGLGVKFMFRMVDGDERFLRASLADDDFFAAEFVEVEGVEGLACFKEDVVGDIDDVVDAANMIEVDHPFWDGSFNVV